ncbi:N-acetylglutamate synthase [Tuber magnatum]|uniref:Amino-acid acetyltransferase, mitochondrial n=1 Tax=Tuber magnatum TaxID=42249 RepID=A0A317SGE3_9PEZI|nr:N-acetylglutamate synthase [Tuber magnatum]
MKFVSRTVRIHSLLLPGNSSSASLNSSARARFFATGLQLCQGPERPMGAGTAEGTATTLPAGVGSSRSRTAEENRDLCLSVLSSTSTKREARAYLQRFTPSLAAPPTQPGAPPPAPLPKFEKQSPLTGSDVKALNRMHAQGLLENNPTVGPGIAPALLTPEMAQEDIHVGLVKIRDASHTDDATLKGVGRTVCQLQRLGLFTIVVVDEALPSANGPEAITKWRVDAEKQVDRVVSAIELERGQARRVDGALSVDSEGSPLKVAPNHLIIPLSRGVIPVLYPIAYNSNQRLVPATANEVVLKLTKLLSTHRPQSPPVDQHISLDRIIFLDPLGGTPSIDRPSGAHVFINLQQEYNDLKNQLNNHHLSNLSTLREALSLLPPTSSGVITTTTLAAAHNLNSTSKRSKNPLIHNLLTDKPLISSSLPVQSSGPATLTTLLKHGIPITIHPSHTKLTDSSKIDLAKLALLIEDSFGKRLDLEHYLSRINDNIAAIIVAGDYEGAAIVTWEYPSEDRTKQRVCYLDKFAVLKKSQGTGGVADVVFKAMVEGVRNGLFEGAEGVIWRSRRWNPVNKWYFERAKGTYKIPDSGWTMFWTTQDAEVSKRRFVEYAGICARIEPSLIDE